MAIDEERCLCRPLAVLLLLPPRLLLLPALLPLLPLLLQV